MIEISSEQMTAIERSRLEEDLVKIIQQLQLQYPDSPPSAELRLQLQPMVDQVLAWSIHSGRFLALHVLACKAIGVDYYTLPGFEAVFADPAISDELKEEWLSGWMTQLRDAKKKASGV
jgi:hypothetical protein